MKQASFRDVVKTVLAGLLGVRRRADHESASARINPVHVVLAALAGAALFVLALLAVVRAVTG